MRLAAGCAPVAAKRGGVKPVKKVKIIPVYSMFKKLFGNASVNTFQRATMETVSLWTNVIARCYGSSQRTSGLAR
jgi:hypothetical protein